MPRRAKSKRSSPKVTTKKKNRRKIQEAKIQDETKYTTMPSKEGATIATTTTAAKNTRHFEIPLFVGFTTMFGYAILTIFGHIRDFFGRLLSTGRYFGKEVRSDVAPLVQSAENFYDRRMYHRIQDVFNRPITGPPGANGMKILERKSTDSNFSFKQTGKTLDVINLGSYNYLGFADDWQETCRDSVLEAFDDFGVGLSSSPADVGYCKYHVQLENMMAEFLKKESCIIFNMGYGTNATTIPSLMGKGSLIISDSLNHTSIVNGVRAAGSTCKVFKHDDPIHLEQVLRKAIVEGQPRKNRPWRKILVICEGVYSMEGEISHLKEIVQVCKKYKAYVYLDEAHSIGAMGATGRGITEHAGVDTSEVDVMMGTFTKSFGGMGGYIAGSKDLIEHIRKNSSGSIYGNSMSPVICKQIIRALDLIANSEIGAKKIKALKDNSNYFRKGLTNLGLQVLGDYDSPVMPILLYNPTKIAAFSRECLKRGLAVVSVGFPATPIISSRARFCISAGHTKKSLDFALGVIDEVAGLMNLRYAENWSG
jgi:serine palmitoyltransferase